MKAIYVLLVLGFGVAAFFGLSALKRMNEKLNKIMKADRELVEISKAAKKDNWQHFRQLEAYQQLLASMKFTRQIPPTRSWAASPDLLLALCELVKKSRPKLIVELGSGLSTLVLAKSIPANMRTKIISIDHSDEYAQKTRDLLKEHRIKNAQIRVAPLRPHISGGQWYEVSSIKDIKRVDFLLIDGPPGSKDANARKPALKEFINKLSPNCIVVIDDVTRQGERELAEAFGKALPQHKLEFLNHEKGTAVLTPRG